MVIAAAIGLAALDSFVPNSHVSTGIELSDTLQAVVFACLTTVGIILLYARRNRVTGTLWITAAILSVPLVMIATPYRLLITSAFPTVNWEHSPLQVMFVPSEKVREDAPQERSKVVTLSIPIEVSGIPESTVFQLNGMMLSIDAPGGQKWDSEWLPHYVEPLHATKHLSLPIKVDRSVYERVKGVPTPVALSLAFSQLKYAHQQRVVAHREFELPGTGHCWVADRGYRVVCRSTDNAAPIVLSAMEDENGCLDERDSLSSNGNATRVEGSNSSFGPFTQLSLLTFSLKQWYEATPSGRVCSGSTLTFTNLEFVRRFRVELSLGRLRLRDYAEPEVRLEVGSRLR